MNYHFHIGYWRRWTQWTWAATLYRGEERIWHQVGTTSSRRRALKQAGFWVRIAIRRFAVAEHVPIVTDRFRRRRP